MPAHAETPGLDRLQAALAEGDMDRVRGELLALGPEDQRLLAQDIGPGAVRRARSAAGRGRRAAKLGRVLVLPGVMGSLLDSVDRGGDAETRRSCRSGPKGSSGRAGS